MSNGNGHRWSKFWWRDHQGDAALRACSLAARGYWIELLCVAHEATPVGYVLINGKRPSYRQLAAIAGCTEREAKKLEDELDEAGVFSRTEDGTIYCRRMKRDSEAAEVGREHIAKRWNVAKQHSPPNSPPNRVPMAEPTRFPTRGPITQKLEEESEEEPDKEERKFSKNNLLPSQNARARGSREQVSAPDALDALLTEAHIEPPKLIVVTASEPAAEPNRAQKAMQFATQTIVGKMAKKLESTGLRPAVKYSHPIKEQILATVKRPEPQIPKGLEAHIQQQRQQLMQAAMQRVKLVA